MGTPACARGALLAGEGRRPVRRAGSTTDVMALDCIVCGAAAAPYFSKRFDAFGLGVVDYWRCGACGLVVSKTHFDLSDAAWEAINTAYHAAFFGADSNEDDPRWMERLDAQRVVIGELARRGALPRGRPWVDFGSGDGKLADALTADGLPTGKFDRYMPGPGFLTEAEMTPGAFDLVLNTSVMEHVRSRAPLDELAGLPAPSGVLASHTLVRGEIPADPSWFYLLPVHTVFFTNRAMALLFAQWGFAASLYSVPARMWFMYRELDEAWAAAEAAADGTALIARRGFIDYWP